MPYDLRNLLLYYLSEFIEPEYARIGVAPSDRPLQATIKILSTFIIEARTDNEPPKKFEEIPDLIKDKTFSTTYKIVRQWYTERFGDVINRKPRDLIGIIIIYGTPFRISIPTFVTRPGKSGQGTSLETIWLRFPDTTLDHEDVISWIHNPPNLSIMPQEQLEIIERDIRRIGTALREIRSNFLSSKGDDNSLSLQHSTLIHLQTFADLVFQIDVDYLKKSFWEIQMACEAAFKSVIMNRTGELIKTHDLHQLYDALNEAHPLTITREAINMIPPWKEMTELRYGLGQPVGIGTCIECYCSALEIIRAVAEANPKHLLFGKAEFELKRPPWHES